MQATDRQTRHFVRCQGVSAMVRWVAPVTPVRTVFFLRKAKGQSQVIQKKNQVNKKNTKKNKKNKPSDNSCIKWLLLFFESF